MPISYWDHHLRTRWTNQDIEENMDLEPSEMRRKLTFGVKIQASVFLLEDP